MEHHNDHASSVQGVPGEAGPPGPSGPRVSISKPSFEAVLLIGRGNKLMFSFFSSRVIEAILVREVETAPLVPPDLVVLLDLLVTTDLRCVLKKTR